MGEQEEANETCPNCGESGHWYRAARCRSFVVSEMPKKTHIEISKSGGECLACGYEEKAVWNA
jgi:hypothetical protein